MKKLTTLSLMIVLVIAFHAVTNFGNCNGTRYECQQMLR